MERRSHLLDKEASVTNTDAMQPNNEGASVSVIETTEEPKAKKPKTKAKVKAKVAKKKKPAKKAKAKAKVKAAPKAKPNGIVGEFHMHAEGPRADLINALGKSLGKLHTADQLAKHFDDNKARVSHVMAMLAKKAQRYKLPYKVVREEGKYGLSAK
jgi:hypothetical protein